MDVLQTDIEGVLIIEPKVLGDARGYFFESFSQREFSQEYYALYEDYSEGVVLYGISM